MTEVIEGEVVDVTEERALVEAVPQRQAATRPAVGIFELGAMDEAEYQRSVQVIRTGQERVKALMRDLLQPGRDFMDFARKGSRDQRVGLLKPGSESLASFFHLVPEFTTKVTTTTFEDGRPDRIDVVVEALAHYGDRDGPVVGAGTGAASSWEVKYHWRNDALRCPECGESGFLLRSKKDPGWFCWKKPEAGKMGCGAQFPDPNDPRIANQEVGRVENPDPHELLNTLVKMSTKRSWTDTVIRALNASSLFTQDVEDMRQQGGGDWGGEYGGGWDDGDASQDRASASARASGARSAQAGHKVGDEWQDGEPERFQGKVERVPDGLRRTEDGRHVLELSIKVGNSRHAIHAEGNMAAWALSVVTAAGQRVAVDGTRWLRKWDDSKPPMRMIRAATKLMVDVDGTWQMYPAATGDPAPGASADPPTSEPSSMPSGSTASGPSEPSAESPSSGSPSPSGSSEAAAPGTSDPKAATTTSSGDGLGDDPGPGPLASSDSGGSGTASDTGTTTTPSPSSVADAATIFDVAQAVGEPGSDVDVTGEVTGSRWAETPGGVRYVAIHILADGHDHQVAIGEGMFHIAVLPNSDEIRWKVGDRLRVKGSWNGAGKVIVATWGLRA